MNAQHDNPQRGTLALLVIGAIFGAFGGWLSATTWLGGVFLAIILLLALLTWITDDIIPDFVTPIFTRLWRIILSMGGVVAQTDLTGQVSARQRVVFGIGFGIGFVLAFWLFHSMQGHAA